MYLHFSLLLALISHVIGTSRSESSTPSLSAEDIIWKVNENVKPKPLENLQTLSHPPPELKLDANRKLAEQLFEGCITLDDQDKDILTSTNLKKKGFTAGKRRIIARTEKRWPLRKIPYEVVHIGLSDQNEEQMREQVERVLKRLASLTCLIFRPRREDDSNWLQFYDGYGCHSDLGKKSVPKAPTQISIGKGCLSDAVLMHLLLHGLGFLHEQNRIDRDSHVDVQWDNIKPEYQEIFKRHSYSGIDILNGKYDFKSIMHFSKYAFNSGDGKETMVAKSDPKMELGGMTLSESDITNIKLYFHCSRFEWREWGPWSACSKPCGVGYHRRKRVCGGASENCKGKQSTEMESCRIARCHSEPGDTTFEDDWGIWKPRSENKCNWRRGRSRNKKQATGPQEDHTTGTGRFAQVKHGDACQKGVQAKIITERVPPVPIGRCLSFVYFIHGHGVGSLDVRFQDLTSNRPTSVWKKEGDQGKRWNKAAVHLPGLPFSYKISMVATIGEPGVSDISVDDIYLDNGQCPDGLGVCENFSNRCQEWASAGECYSNTKWMMLSCCKSCSVLPECVDTDPSCKENAMSGQCRTKKEEMWSKCCKSCEDCLDKDNRCPGWAQSGECESNSDWMSDNCRKSCNLCRQ